MERCIRIISRSSGVRRTVDAANSLIGGEVVVGELIGLDVGDSLVDSGELVGSDCVLPDSFSVVDSSSFEYGRRHIADLRRLDNKISSNG